jgi:hypothetical protein
MHDRGDAYSEDERPQSSMTVIHTFDVAAGFYVNRL